LPLLLQNRLPLLSFSVLHPIPSAEACVWTVQLLPALLRDELLPLLVVLPALMQLED